LLLAATVRSFAHMPLGISDGNIYMVMILVRSGMPLIMMRREIDLLNRYRLTAIVKAMLKKFLLPLTTK